MKKIIIIFEILVLVVASSLIQSCTEGSIYPNLPPNGGGGPNLIDSGYYPNTLNSYWKYAVNYTFSYYDTVNIRISSIMKENNNVQILFFDYQSKFNAYQVYEELNDTSVVRQNIFSSMGCDEQMLIPLSVGLKWNNYCYNLKDSTEYSRIPFECIVESLDSVMVGKTNYLAYKIVFSITDTTLAPNGIPFAVETQYFVPYVGFVKGVYESMWDPIGRQYYEHTMWELIDYKIEKK